ncbi:neoverrucotoxin subunit alpha-like isoform X2 [Fundulus heteroclitus]|uniref:neoverrucotoxin subunit alpha-like isoform X2 n=1 Tax=Fundulus heteroclitus TaxID=8078 RepID=UPI00165C7292|nr:neoverrucotoxin subunit alpha-like isoform X2 [Fundulus heteroclitus]
MSSDQVQVSALGFTLWDRETINKHNIRQTQRSSSCEISVSDSFESKSSLLDLNASVKASFLGGLVEVEGSAAYLNDKKQFKNQSRIIFQYKATTEYKGLSLSSLKVEDSRVRDYTAKISATHVVTGILYGANAFFVFDSEKLDSNSVQTIEGTMHAVIKKIPLLDVEGKAQLQLSEEEKDASSKFTCKFYGDFILDKNPVTLEDAVKTYAKLPDLCKNGEHAVPLKVWLTPLKDLEPTAAELKEQISFGLLRKARIYLESIREIEMRCSEAQQEKEVMIFPQIHRKLIIFEDLCKDNIEMLRQTMQEKIPLIREGKEDETSLENLLDQQENSLFSPKSLHNWLDNAEREINVIRSCVGIMEGIQIGSDKNNLDKKVLAPGVDDVFCFVFTSVKTDDPFLDQMINYLSKDKTEPQPSVPPSTRDQWFFSDEVVTNMRKKVNEFSSASKRLKGSSRFCFVVAALPNAKFNGATIYQYRDGLLKTEDFSRPEVPNVTAQLDRRDLAWYYCNLTLDPDTCNNWLVLSDENTKATCGTLQQQYDENPWRFKDCNQVLCQQGLTGCCYFEVELGFTHPESVGVALAYYGMPRSEKNTQDPFGKNMESWSFGVFHDIVESRYDNKQWSQPLPADGCSRVGVYLDWSGGSLSFYNVVSNQLIHLYTYNAKFTKPLYPGLYAWGSPNFASFIHI